MRQTLSAQAAGTKLRGRCMTSASKSLDLLRLNIQTVINKEIDAVLKKYLDVSKAQMYTQLSDKKIKKIHVQKLQCTTRFPIFADIF